MPINTHAFSHQEVMAYLDGELAPETAAEITAHLAHCKTCQEIAADLQGVSRQLSGWAVQATDAAGLPAALVAALETRAAEKTVRHRHVSPWRILGNHPWAAVAASLTVLIAGLFFFSSARRPVGYELAPAPMPIQPEQSSVAPMDAPRLQRFANLQSPPKKQETSPLIILTAELRLTARTFDTVRGDLGRILSQFGGHIAQLDIASPTGQARSLTATLRIPAPQLEAALNELRKLGHVEGESRRGEEVTQQSVDLEARLSNSRHTEQRLTEILAARTGKLSDVLEVEEKLAEVRGQIEQAEAEQKSLNNRISLATISLQVNEDYRAPLTGTVSPSIGTRLSNSAMDGLHAAFNGIIGLMQVILAAGPSLLLWGLLLGLPGYFLWKKLRRR
jgi:hypothetical protein